MIKNRVIPICWGTKHQELEYNREYFKDPGQESDWIVSGHQHEALCVELHVVKSMYPWMQYITDYFPEVDNLSFCFSRFPPGTYLPTHIDRYAFYSRANQVQDPSKIVRYVLFLEDARPGHILQVDQTIYHDWPAGLCVGWTYDTPHLAANLGLQDRYTLQITGTAK